MLYLHPPVPGPTYTHPDGTVWSINAKLEICRNGVPTNGHGMAIAVDETLANPDVFVKSPNPAKGLHWYRWTGSVMVNSWVDLGSADDPFAQTTPIVTFTAYVWDNVAWANAEANT